MKLQILDDIAEGNAICYLCKIGLPEYINAIPNDYKDFDVQRGIVNNKYLDHLVDTIAEKKHIPPIVLVAEDIKIDNNWLYVPKFKILDGLQRTHRLKVIFETIKLLLSSENKDEIRDNPNRYSRDNSNKIKEIGSNTKLLRSLVSSNCLSLNEPNDFFIGNNLWIEVWTNLNEEEQIKKMLLLNAGHKAVNIKHQLELLFLGTLLQLEKHAPDNIEFIREKNQSAIQYSKSRKLGTYHFSHIISALISLSAGKVVNTNSDFVSNIQSDSVKDIDLIDGFDLSLLEIFIKFLSRLDNELNKKYGERGVKWIGREVVLVGLFGAVGAYAKDRKEDMHKTLSTIYSSIDSLTEKLNLDSFEDARNKIELNKVNVGNINKKAVFSAITDILTSNTIKNWSEYFGGSSK